MASSNYPDGDINEQNVTNESNKFGSSGGNKSKQNNASKGQGGREITKNSWKSKEKTEIGEHVLNRPPKKPEGKEAGDIDTTTTITRVTPQLLRILAKQPQQKKEITKTEGPMTS